MRGHPTLLGLTSHHQPPSPTTGTPAPASDRPFVHHSQSFLAQLAPPTHEGSPHPPWTHITSPATLSYHWNTCTSLRQGCFKLLPPPFFTTLSHSLHSLLPQLMRGHPTLLGLTSPTTGTLAPASDSHSLNSLLPQLMRGHPTLLGLTSHHQPPSPTTGTPTPTSDSHSLHSLLPQLMRGHPTLLGLTSHHQPPSPTTGTPAPASDSHSLHSLLPQLMRRHPTLLGLTSHHQPPSPTTGTPAPASDRVIVYRGAVNDYQTLCSPLSVIPCTACSPNS
ncbi:hypothetical protein LR48_Vigan316s001000 [Vigna angularis]|uniref:Uncharacterized protein n=1 Tax=Phaseolus angularis TaxID=3914 RepID=A0A0L9T862_PHAAN|nr:hypothetical protein LR48_Vigan316s001000 [Vigna angularis]